MTRFRDTDAKLEWGWGVSEEGMNVIFHGRGIWIVGARQPNMVAPIYPIPCIMILALVHQEVEYMFPLLESGWACDYRRRDSTWLLRYVTKGGKICPALSLGRSSLRLTTTLRGSEAITCSCSSLSLSWGPSQLSASTTRHVNRVSFRWLKPLGFSPFQLMSRGAKTRCSCQALPKLQIHQQNQCCGSSHKVLGVVCNR